MLQSVAADEKTIGQHSLIGMHQRHGRKEKREYIVLWSTDHRALQRHCIVVQKWEQWERGGGEGPHLENKQEGGKKRSRGKKGFPRDKNNKVSLTHMK